MVTIKFWRTRTSGHPEPFETTRYWNHVPRQGEYIDFGDGVSGKIDMVFWADDYITVRFK